MRAELAAPMLVPRRLAIWRVGVSLLITGGVVLSLVIMLFPVVWLLLSSLKLQREIFTIPPAWIFIPTFQHYVAVFQRPGVIASFINSAVIAFWVMVLSLAVGSFAAYSFARFRFVGNSVLIVLILITRMTPPVVIVLPLYLLFRRLGILDTRLSVILAHSAISIPFVVWMMRAFFEGIPQEMEEAAMVDGCTHVGTLFRVTMPLAAPGLVTTAIFTLIDSWNEYIMAFIITGEASRTLPVAVAGFIGEKGVDFGPMFASGIVALTPVLICATLIRKHLVRGLTFGALK